MLLNLWRDTILVDHGTTDNQPGVDSLRRGRGAIYYFGGERRFQRESPFLGHLRYDEVRFRSFGTFR